MDSLNNQSLMRSLTSFAAVGATDSGCQSGDSLEEEEVAVENEEDAVVEVKVRQVMPQDHVEIARLFQVSRPFYGR